MRIPKVKTYLVRMLDERGRELKRCHVLAPTKLLARLNHTHEHLGEAISLGAYQVKYSVVRGSK